MGAISPSGSSALLQCRIGGHSAPVRSTPCLRRSHSKLHADCLMQCSANCPCSSMQLNAVSCSHCIAVSCTLRPTQRRNAIQCNAVQSNALQCDSRRSDAIQFNPIWNRIGSGANEKISLAAYSAHQQQASSLSSFLFSPLLHSLATSTTWPVTTTTSTLKAALAGARSSNGLPLSLGN